MRHHTKQWIGGGLIGVTLGLCLYLTVYVGPLSAAIAAGAAACATAWLLLRRHARDLDALEQRAFWRDEILAILDLERQGGKSPSAFDGGAYIEECTGLYIEAAKAARA